MWEFLLNHTKLEYMRVIFIN